MIVIPPADGHPASALVLSGALGELALLPGPNSAAEALLRVRAILLADGDRVTKLVLISAAALEGIIADEQDARAAPADNVIALPIGSKSEARP